MPSVHTLVRKPKIIKKVPKGTSEYQAAWIVESDEEEDEDDDVEDEEGSEESEEEMEEDLEPNEEEGDFQEQEEKMETMSQMESFGNLGDTELDMGEMTKYREEREEVQWPDEVETPHDVPARQRFQKYRGLKSFRYTLHKE